ncbi:MAG: choice-of-anchor D domain-containing protein [Candidatus Cloacimonetes bacterium]|nr:choice-of-anchor D domain-containing protein [Candidatus Cloacimonadota bacterium]
MKKKILVILLSLVVFCTVFANSTNQTIDINANEAYLTIPESYNIEYDFFPNEKIERLRYFDYNRELVKVTNSDIGQTVKLNFFADKQYTAQIVRASVYDSGNTVLTAQIDGQIASYAYITVSEVAISMSVELPFADEYYFASVKKGNAILGLKKYSDVKADELEGTYVNVPDSIYQEKRNSQATENTRNYDPITIDLLIVYTSNAAVWALSNSSVTNIDHVIDLAIERSNLVHDNSNTVVTYNIVHRHLTDYVETDTGADLEHATTPNSGGMDEIPFLRNLYYADMTVFIAQINYTGGAAWLLQNWSGFTPDYYAVSINRVQQAHIGFTVVHEMGHNQGAHHHADQNVQPGPNYSLGLYSSGWRGYVGGVMSCTIMTYEQGTYFSDGINATRLPYLSSPLITVDGAVIGDATLYDNARVIRESKVVTSNYRVGPEPVISIEPNFYIFENTAPGFVSEPQEFVVTNTHNASLAITSIQMSGTDQNNFTLTTNTLPVTLAPNQSTTFSATFSPISMGNKIAGVAIEVNSSGATHNVMISGTVILTPYPAQVVALTPAIGAINQSLTPTLIWTKPTSAGVPNGYYIYLGTNANPYAAGDPENNRIATISSGDTTLFEIETALDYETTYHWQIVAYNDFGSGQPSLSRSFTTQLNIPGQVVATSPDPGAQNQSLKPVLTWQVPTTGGNPTGYFVYMATSENPYNPSALPQNRVGMISGPDVTSWEPTSNLELNTTYHWQIVARNTTGNGEASVSRFFTTISETSVDDGTSGIFITALLGNFPNPFNPDTVIKFSLATDTDVEISIFNSKGQKVSNQIYESLKKGNHSIVWNGQDQKGVPVGSGVYYYKLKTEKYEETKRMLLIK